MQRKNFKNTKILSQDLLATLTAIGVTMRHYVSIETEITQIWLPLKACMETAVAVQEKKKH